MKYYIFFTISLLCVTTIVQSQDLDTTYWKKGGAATFTFSQVSLTNWAAGGQNSVSMNGYVNVFAKYNRDKISWSNNLEMGYGVVKQGNIGNLKKTDDIISASTQFGYKISGKTLFWSSLIDFKTQFYVGENEEGKRISDFLAPGYLLVATGLDWKPTTFFSLTYTPVTGKITFVLDEDLANSGSFGVKGGEIDPNNPLVFLSGGKTTRAELGSFLKAIYTKENIVKNVNFSSRLELFSNYLREFGNVDINWQNALVMKVNSWLSVNWQSQLIYDDDIKIATKFDDISGEPLDLNPKVQFKSVFGVGISMKFGDPKK